MYVLRDKKPVFLRNILFLTTRTDSRTIAIVREWGATSDRGVWEPPKGQMEWKEFRESGIKPHSVISEEDLYRYMKEGVLREMQEEAKVLPNEITGLTALPLSYMQAWPSSHIPGASFQYQFWKAHITNATMKKAQSRIQELVDHPSLARTLPHDVLEKDAIVWWSPSEKWAKIRGAFSKKMTQLYYAYLDKYGV